MQPVNMEGHGRTLSLPQTLEEDALQAEFRHALVRLHHGRHLKQPVGGAHVAVTWRVTAAHDDALVGFVQDFEVVGDQGASTVVGGAQVFATPEVFGCFGGFVFTREVGSLSSVSFILIVSYSRAYYRGKGEREYTPSTPNPRTEGLNQTALFLQ